MKRLLTAIALLALVAVPVAAQLFGTPGTTPGPTGGTQCPPGLTWGDGGQSKAIGATEVDTRAVQFTGKTLATADTVTVTLISGTDASPSALYVSATKQVNGDVMSAQFAPNTGCGAAGCRNNNVYQIEWCASEGSNDLCGYTCLQVKTPKYSKLQ